MFCRDDILTLIDSKESSLCKFIRKRDGMYGCQGSPQKILEVIKMEPAIIGMNLHVIIKIIDNCTFYNKYKTILHFITNNTDFTIKSC